MEDDHVGLGSPSDSEENGVDKNFVQSSESESESEMDIEQQEVPKKRTRVSILLGGPFFSVCCAVEGLFHYTFQICM
jgi:hypothetical protein